MHELQDRFHSNGDLNRDAPSRLGRSFVYGTGYSTNDEPNSKWRSDPRNYQLSDYKIVKSTPAVDNAPVANGQTNLSAFSRQLASDAEKTSEVFSTVLADPLYSQQTFWNAWGTPSLPEMRLLASCCAHQNSLSLSGIGAKNTSTPYEASAFASTPVSTAATTATAIARGSFLGSSVSRSLIQKQILNKHLVGPSPIATVFPQVHTSPNNAGSSTLTIAKSSCTDKAAARFNSELDTDVLNHSSNTKSCNQTAHQTKRRKRKSVYTRSKSRRTKREIQPAVSSNVNSQTAQIEDQVRDTPRTSNALYEGDYDRGSYDKTEKEVGNRSSEGFSASRSSRCSARKMSTMEDAAVEPCGNHASNTLSDLSIFDFCDEEDHVDVQSNAKCPSPPLIRRYRFVSNETSDLSANKGQDRRHLRSWKTAVAECNETSVIRQLTR